MPLKIILTILSGSTFLIYGILCITTDHMITEFTRYKLLQFRVLVGFLELLGGLGTLIGLSYKPILLFSTAGLSVLMLLGVIVRLKIQDPIIQIVPAFTLMIINLFIFYKNLP